MDGGAWWAIVQGGCKESDMTEQLDTESVLNLVFLMFRVFAVLTWISTSAKISISIQVTFFYDLLDISLLYLTRMSETRFTTFVHTAVLSSSTQRWHYFPVIQTET